MKTLEIIYLGIVVSLTSFPKSIEQECQYDINISNAGTFVFLDAENVTKSFGMALDSSLRSIVVKGGFAPLSLPSMYVSGPAFIPMEEGYVVARPYPKRNYVAFDTFLWGRVQSVQELNAAFSVSVGGNAKYSYTKVKDVIATWDHCPSSMAVHKFKEDWSLDGSSTSQQVYDDVGDMPLECSLVPNRHDFSNSKSVFQQTIFIIKGIGFETTIEEINERLRRSLEKIGIQSKSIRRWDTVNAKEAGWLVHSILPSGNVILYWDAMDMISINVFLKEKDHAWETTFTETFIDTRLWQLKAISHVRG